MTDEDVEKIIKQNMNLQMNLSGIRADFEEAVQRTWVGLDEKDKHSIEIEAAENDFTDLGVILATEAKLKEKNTRNGGCL